MDKELFGLRMKVEETEEELNELKKSVGEIPFAYEACQKAINQQKEIWERVLHFSKGTDSERQVYQKLEALEDKQRKFTRAFSMADEEIEKELADRKARYERAEQLFEKGRREVLDENNV
ncbi:hypothetical protein [Enterococcus rivorum]|uniref:Uncharacterized protein n=1 Tax=Enterococcus rivorum TaxID=762845 RepID=A0A1E5L0R6_9ENTE|nr:hypothetical protein [Enterococcus rivorum]MBP2098439.1 flagellar biosynthesis chaperone FliJ [Enterococcus rivorum]OEH83706.1 hypothetical protein BCR26_08550 [Enterococcus rivorum]